MVVDRPGRSDKAVVIPVDGVVAAVRRVPGDDVKAGEELFVVRLPSDRGGGGATQARDRRKDLEAGCTAIPAKTLAEQDRLVAQHELTVRLNSEVLLARGLPR